MGRRSTGLGFCVLAGLAACTSTTGPGADGDAGATPDAVLVRDGDDRDATPQPPDARALDADLPSSGACSIGGSAAAAYHLRGEPRLSRDAGGVVAARPQQLDLYLPEGRTAGARVLLAFPTAWPATALTVVEGRFAADLSVAGLNWESAYGGALSFRGRMAAPSGPLELSLSGNINFETDIIDAVDGSATLCPTGPATAPTLLPSRVVSPRGVVDLVPSAPIAGDVSVVRLVAGGAPVPADVSLNEGVLRVAARAWLAPGTAVTIDPNGLRDVMGRAFTLDGSVTALATTTVVTDRDFNAAPPTGAVATDTTLLPMGGRLRVSQGRSEPFRILVALGTFDGAARLRVDTSLPLHCERPTSAWLVGADGAHLALSWEPSSVASDPYARTLRSAVSSAGPWWLLVESDITRSRPGSLPEPACAFALDRVAAE